MAQQGNLEAGGWPNATKKKKKKMNSPRPRAFFGAGSVKGSVVNIAAATLGAGALSLPRAFYYAGIPSACCCMLLMVVLAVISIRTITQTVHLSQKDTFEEIAKKAFGPWFTLFFEVNIILFCSGTAVGYMMTVGDITASVVDRIFGSHLDELGFLGVFLQSKVLLCIITVFVLFPLSMFDRINELRYASLLGVMCIFVLVGVVIYVFLRDGMSPTLTAPDTLQPKDGIMGCFKMLSLAIFAFCCQPNVPSIYCELERKSFRRMRKVGIRGMTLCFGIYLLIGASGFLAFGEITNGNVMINLHPLLCKDDPIVIFGFVCMAFAVTMAFPLNIFPIRFSVETFLFYYRPHLNTKLVRFAIGAAAVGLSLCGAILIPSINLVFELVGATTGSFVCFIGPGMLFCKLDKSPPGRFFQRSKWPAICLVVVGTCFAVLGTVSSILDMIDSSGQESPNIRC